MDFEKLGAFYLGKEFDSKNDALTDRLVMYDSRDLTTHAVCIGMTGSGKTGLCIDLLEEAAIDNVPAIIIDPKGDITNLLLTFPDLLAEDFEKWVNADDARRKGQSISEFAKAQADLWKKGLSNWGQDGNRIELLRNSADFVIYTPGSDAGVSVSMLQSFKAPDLNWDNEAEILRERVQGTVSALLGLVGIKADPLRSREHIYLANIFEHYWRLGENLELAKLILSIQDPPIRKLGVFDVDTFFPQKERFELAMRLNNLMASPGFQSWIDGQPLDIDGFLHTPSGKTRHSIFYIAHLNDSERMFFVTMLLNQLITWMRSQSGTTSLRALLYMDEVFGFFPPVTNPPSKTPFLTILKQARAYGLGAVLTTQNPVDLDYKGLTNAGTWFIGRLQTERDKMRVLDGLESATASAGKTLKKNDLSSIISSLGSRVFLLHNVHEDRPIIFQTRWAMSYLRGPLTRDQIRTLNTDWVPDTISSPSRSTKTEVSGTIESIKPTHEKSALSTSPPQLSLGLQPVFLPLKKGVSSAIYEIEKRDEIVIEPTSKKLIYRPFLIAAGDVRFVDSRNKIDLTERFSILTAPPRSGNPNWDEGSELDLMPRDILGSPEPDALFENIPNTINELKDIKHLEKDFIDYFILNRSKPLFYSPVLKLYSKPGEDERDFKTRLNQAARENRDNEMDKINKKYEKQLRGLSEKINRAQAAYSKKMAVTGSRKTELMVSVGESVLGYFLGRRSTRDASTTAGKYRMSRTAKMSAEEEKAKIELLENEVIRLEGELKSETDDIAKRWDSALKELEEVRIKPRKKDLRIELFSLAWSPFWEIKYKPREGELQSQLIEAF